MQHKAMHDFLLGSGATPVMVRYQSDPTPITHANRIQKPSSSTSSVSHPTVRRHGQQASDFLLQRVVAIGLDAAGDVQSRVLVMPPLELDSKKVWSLYSCYVQVCPFLPCLRAAGINISISIFDRGVASPLSRRIHQQHALHWHQRPEPQEGSESLQPYLDWDLGLGCIIHDLHNALKWGVNAVLNLTDASSKLTQVVRLLRHSLQGLHDSIPMFLSRFLEFRSEIEDPEQSRLFWTTLGLEASWLDTAVCLGLRFEGGHLMCNPGLSQETAVQEVSTFVLHLMHFYKHTESRWLSINFACRYLLQAQQVGLLR